MEYTIRKCTVNDASGRGIVHYQSWQETYTGLMLIEFLNETSPEKMGERAALHTDNNTFVAVVEKKVVGFGTCLQKSREFVSVKPSGEIVGLYLLREYHGLGIGRSLLNALKDELTEKNIVLFVLKSNEHAIGFYKHMGFAFTGKSIVQKVSGGVIEELEMALKR